MLQISEGRDDKHNVAGGVFSFEFGGCDPVDKGGSIPSLVLGEALTHSERGLDANSRYLGICIELGLLPAVWSSVIGEERSSSSSSGEVRPSSVSPSTYACCFDASQRIQRTYATFSNHSLKKLRGCP